MENDVGKGPKELPSRSGTQPAPKRETAREEREKTSSCEELDGSVSKLDISTVNDFPTTNSLSEKMTATAVEPQQRPSGPL